MAWFDPGASALRIVSSRDTARRSLRRVLQVSRVRPRTVARLLASARGVTVSALVAALVRDVRR